MNIKDLEVRIYVLVGQLEEAKKVYKDAMVEIEKQNKESEVKVAEPVA